MRTTRRTRCGPVMRKTASRAAFARARGALRAAFQRCLRDGRGVGNWDGHKSIYDQYPGHAHILDQPTAALIKDLKQRGLLETTLVVWCTEFGRSPLSRRARASRPQSRRLHGWLAGAGVKAPLQLRSDGRVRLEGGREHFHRLRFPRHDSALVRNRPRAAHLVPQRHGAPAHGCARACHPRGAGVMGNGVVE